MNFFDSEVLRMLLENFKIRRQCNSFLKIPTIAKKILHVSGAGNTVTSTITMTLKAGCNITESAYLANYVGDLVCEVEGIVPIELDDLFNSINSESI